MTTTASRSRGVVSTLPMRFPDTGSTAVMSRRGWWLLVIGFLIPGSAQVLAGNKRLGRFGLGSTIVLWVGVIVVAAVGIAAPDFSLWLVGQQWLFIPLTYLLQAALIFYAVLWIVLGVNTLVLIKFVFVRPRARLLIALLSVASLVLAGGTAAYAVNVIGTTRSTYQAVFENSAPPVAASNGYYNILLLGADSGDGRDSMRFDSISVVSINAETGAVTITGIPRDMKDVPFAPGPMQDLYPDGHTGHTDPTCGWSSAINQLNTELEICRADEGLYPDAISNGSTPGIEATKDAAEGVLGIEIPYYVFVDMNHFAQLIDALGGVDINVTTRLPEGGGPPEWDPNQSAEEWATGWIEVGQQHMDGRTAQWYARSRYTTSDWDRMQRQRILQEAMLKQFTPQTVLTRFQEIAQAGTAVMETDVPSTMTDVFVNLAVKAKEQPVTTLELNPNGSPTPDGAVIDPDNPDFEQIRLLVDQTLHPVESTPSP